MTMVLPGGRGWGGSSPRRGGWLGVTGYVACGKEQWQAGYEHRRDEPGDGCQPGQPDARLLLCSENPLKAGNGFGSAGGQGGGPGTDGGQGDQRGGQVVAAVAADGRVVGCHLGQHGKLGLGLAEQRHSGECAGQCCGQRQDHVVVTAQVRAFVGEDGTELRWGEGGEGTGRDHDLVPAAGQAVDGGSILVDDRDVQLIAWEPGGGHQGGVLAPV